MNVEHINPFIKSAVTVFDTMLNCSLKRESLSLKDGCSPSYDVTAIIGLSGKACGSVVFSISRDVAFRIVEQMLGTETTEVNQDVVDATGELTNMIAGSAKAELAEYELSLGLPNVIVGRNHVIRFPGNIRPLCIRFNTSWGPLSLEVGLDTESVQREPQAAVETAAV